MIAKQLSVFIENRNGRLSEVLEVLKKNNINIISLSLADTTEFGLLRLIVSDPEKGKKMLSDSGFSATLSEILIVKIKHIAGSLQTLLDALSNDNINIEYMYGLSIDKEKASIVIKASDLNKADSILHACGAETLTAEEAAK